MSWRLTPEGPGCRLGLCAVGGYGIVRHDQHKDSITRGRPGENEVLPEAPVFVELPIQVQQVAALPEIESEGNRLQWVREHLCGLQASGSFRGQRVG